MMAYIQEYSPYRVLTLHNKTIFTCTSVGTKDDQLIDKELHLEQQDDSTHFTKSEDWEGCYSLYRTSKQLRNLYGIIISQNLIFYFNPDNNRE